MSLPVSGFGNTKRHRSFLADLGRQLADRRVRLGISQRECARRAGVSGAAICRIEHGHMNATLALVARIATSLDARLEFVVRPSVGR